MSDPTLREWVLALWPLALLLLAVVAAAWLDRQDW